MIEVAGTLPSDVVAQAVATIALGLLGMSGVAKLVDPGPTTGALDAARLPSSDALSRLLGMTEVVVAIAALSVGGYALAAAAVMYAAFSVFALWALRGDVPLRSCGCFGQEDTPPTAIHVGYNVTAVVALVTALALGLVPVDWSMTSGQLGIYLGFGAIGVYASYLLMTRLPQLLQLARTS